MNGRIAFAFCIVLLWTRAGLAWGWDEPEPGGQQDSAEAAMSVQQEPAEAATYAQQDSADAATYAQQDSGGASASAQQDSDGAATYRLAAGDRVVITVFGHADLSGEFEINGAGMISMPLISDVDASGLTVNELETAIVDDLQPDYLINPKVSVEILDFRPIYIIGEVINPGSYPYKSGMTVINAVAVAGGFSYRAKKSKLIIRRDGGDQAVEIRVDLDAVVLPGDVIEVPERFF